MTDKAKETKAARAERNDRAERADAEPRASHNPLTIPWPTDPQGALSALKSGGVAAVKRINGDPEKLKRFERTLRLLQQHARARFDIDSKARETARDNAVAAQRRIEARDRRILERDLKAAEAKANSIRSQIEASEKAEEIRNPENTAE